MNSRQWRVATISGSLVALGGLAVLACSDSTNRITHRDAAVSPLGRASAAAMRDKRRIHERNKEEFAGVAHNKALDDFRRELRKPGVLTRNVCDYVMTFGAHSDRLPANNRVGEDVRWRTARSAADSSGLCRKTAKPRLSDISFRSPVEPLARATLTSSVALALVSEIENAVASSSDSYELAGRLNTVLDRVSDLDVSDQLLVASTVSVAQNSFEYWETNYDVFVREVQDEYSGCASEQSAGGVSSETARDNCLGGRGDGGAVALYDRSGPQGPRMAGTRPGTACEVDLRAGFKKIAAADVKGAFSGFIGGMVAGGFDVAIAGAIVSAAIGSTYAAMELAWEVFTCIYHF
jgi:hypothetical protein